MNRMKAVTVFLCLTFPSVCCLLSASEAVINITAKLGDTIILPCKAPSNSHILALQWIRPDLGPDYVYFYRDGRPEPKKQHPSFLGRVELNDSRLQDDVLSLSLKNVTNDDKGTYRCCVIQSNRMKRDIIDTEPISTVTLTVSKQGLSPSGGGENKNGGDKHGHVGLVALVIMSVLGFILGGVVVSYRKSNRLSEQSYQAATSGS